MPIAGHDALLFIVLQSGGWSRRRPSGYAAGQLSRHAVRIIIVCAAIFCHYGLCAGKDDDLAKLAFTKAACSKPDPFAVPMECDVELNNTLQWLSSKSSMEVWQHSCNASPSFFCLLFQVNEYRKGVINKIEALAAVSCCSTFSCACALHAVALRFLRRSPAPALVLTGWQEHPVK